MPLCNFCFIDEYFANLRYYLLIGGKMTMLSVVGQTLNCGFRREFMFRKVEATAMVVKISVYHRMTGLILLTMKGLLDACNNPNPCPLLLLVFSFRTLFFPVLGRGK